MSSGRPNSSTTLQSDRSNNQGTTNTTSGAGSNTNNIEANTDEENRAFDYTMLSDDGPGRAAASSAENQQHDSVTTTTRATTSSVPVEKQLSPFDATIHLLKGNLGTKFCRTDRRSLLFHPSFVCFLTHAV